MLTPAHVVTNCTSTDDVAAVNVYVNGGVLYEPPNVFTVPQLPVPAQIWNVQVPLPVFLLNALIVYDAPGQTDIVWSIIAEAVLLIVQSLCHTLSYSVKDGVRSSTYQSWVPVRGESVLMPPVFPPVVDVHVVGMLSNPPLTIVGASVAVQAAAELVVQAEFVVVTVTEVVKDAV